MHWDHIAGKWTEMKGKVRERWAKLTDTDLARIAGKREQLASVLQERYGWVREQADQQIKDFESSFFVGAASRLSGREADDEEESMQSR